MVEHLVCPLCKQSVSKKIYDEITGIWAEKQKLEQNYQGKLAKLNKKMNDIKQKIELREKRKYENQIIQIRRGLNKSIKVELNKKLREKERLLKLQLKTKEAKIVQISQNKINTLQKQRTLSINRVDSLTRITAKQQKKIVDLENQLKKQTTPQVEGLLYEDKLLEALRNDFPGDKFQHTGKGGDIVHSIIYKNNHVGTIVYECKKVLKFLPSHINQAAKAKCQRNADFSILVTNASKKGYNGFTIEKAVIIIHPAGVLSLVKLLRDRIIQIANMKISKAQKNKVIQEIIEYMESAQFKNSLESVIQIVKDEYEDLKKEVKEHCNRWIKKRDAYRNIYTEIVNVKQKTLDSITGEKSKPALPLKFTLSLPEAKEE